MAGGNLKRGELWKLGVKIGVAPDPQARIGRLYQLHVGSASQFVTADELRQLLASINAALRGPAWRVEEEPKEPTS